MSVMPNIAPPGPATVYQLRAVVHGISPLIWRRLLVPTDTTIAELHTVLQTAFGWGGQHLHQFVIHGVPYGISYLGGVGFRDDAHRVRLADLGLRPTERFIYDYNFIDGWRVDLRVEQIGALDPGRVYPRCTGGRRAGPPEDCGGVWAFLEQTQPHHVWAATIRVAEILGLLLDEDLAGFGEHRDELAALLPLLGAQRFDRRQVNRGLAALAATWARAA
jgi:Plasmid pRiA4b ORF-3-like protein